MRSFIYDLKTNNMTLTDKRKLEAQREREAQEKVKNISSNVPVMRSDCDEHQWKYLCGTPQNETWKCKVCGATG